MSDVLITDLYEANMALAHLGENMTDRATFSLFVRNLPPERGYLVAAGLEQALSYLERFRVDDSDLLQLGHALNRPDGLLGAAARRRFRHDLDQLPAPVRRIQRPMTVVPVVSAQLGRLTNQVRNRLTTR